MQNEILKPVLATDETAIPRYDIVNPDGSVSQQNVELRLKNEIMQQGTPYDEDSVLPAKLATQLGLPTTATPAQVLQLLATKSYDKDKTLSNETKTLFGLDVTAVPDDVFKTLGAELRVTTEVGAVVTASKDNATVSATANSSGIAVLKLPRLGTWIISTTINGVPISVNYNVKAIAQCELVLATSLENASWNVIEGISNSGKANSIWSVGDRKTINVGGTSYQIQIIGFNHDTKTAGGKAGITFQLVDSLNTTYPMNSANTNVGGWKNSEMRSRMSVFFGQLDDDLQSVIKPVNKLVSVGNNNSTIETVSDKLFLLSEIEVFGHIDFSFSGEGSQYAYYKAGNSRVKNVNGSPYAWLERSPNKNSIYYFCAVKSSGATDNYVGNNNGGVSFGFCV